MEIFERLGWWSAFVIVGALVVYHMGFAFTVGAALWPRRPGVHFLHQLEGAIWPAVWTVVLMVKILKGIAWCYNLVISLFSGLGQKVGGTRHGVVRDANVERRFEGIRRPDP